MPIKCGKKLKSSRPSWKTENRRGTLSYYRCNPLVLSHLWQSRFSVHFLLVILAMVSLLFPACHGVRPISVPPEVVEKVAARAGVYPRLLEDSWSEIESMGGFFTIKAEHRGRSYQAKNTLVMKKPSLFRLEILNPMGLATTLLISDGSTFFLYYPEAGEYLHESPTRENFKKILGIGLDSEELLLVWMGQFLSFSNYQITRVEWHPKSLLIRVIARSQSAPLEAVYWIDPIKERLIRGSIRDLSTEKDLFNVEYSHFIQLGGKEVPGRVTVFLVKERVKLTLNAAKINCNLPAIESSAFRFVPPAKARRVLLEEIKSRGPIIFGR